MGGTKIGRLADDLGYWHNRFGRLVDDHLERRMAEDGDLSVFQWYVLLLLHHREADTVAEIAAAAAIDASEVSRLVARLEFKGLVARRVGRPSDGARGEPGGAAFKLTRKGKQRTLELAAAAEASARVCFGALSHDEVRQYKSLLAKLLGAHGDESERELIEASLS